VAIVWLNRIASEADLLYSVLFLFKVNMNKYEPFFRSGIVVMIKKFKVTIILLVLSLILVACGDPKVGDMFMLKRNTLGGMNVNSMENTMNELKALEEVGNPDSMEEYVDFNEIPSFSVGTVVRVIETREKDRMVQIQNVYPKTKSIMKMWIDTEELNNALK